MAHAPCDQPGTITDAVRFIVLTDHQPLREADAIVLLEGDGLARVEEAVRLYRRGYAPRIVVSGALTCRACGSFPCEDLVSALVEHGVPESAIVPEGRSLNTREQAEEVLALATHENWKALLLVASHYHVYRAMLTFIATATDRRSGVRVIPAPARELSWYAQNPWGRRIDLLDREFERIVQYRESGHCATFSSGIRYYQDTETKMLDTESR